MKNLEKTIEKLSGFKIPNSHFRIGSKLHISDFYYAKRFFQNGFFSSRNAFIISKDIISYIEKEEKLDDIKRNGLTIIGYEMYSELLISLVDKFLRKKWQLGKNKINHNLYEDFENLKLCKKNNILSNVVIIVPIASTFSTSIKIENQILKDYEEVQKEKEENDDAKREKPFILQPHLNVLHVSNGIPTDKINEEEAAFSWKSKDIKSNTVVVEANYSIVGNTERVQKYYLTLPSKWHIVEDCKLCNPIVKKGNKEVEKLENEYPLYETDKTAVTPATIFDFPRGRTIDDKDLNRKIDIDAKIIKYGHHTRNSSHFLYSINTESFLENNKDEVQNWLLEIKKSPEFRKIYKETDRVIIVSTCHFSNASFISLVNDHIFGSSANIIHYDPSNDYVQNFKIVYGQEIKAADKIFFVDDSLKSGASFDRIHQFIEATLDGSPNRIYQFIKEKFNEHENLLESDTDTPDQLQKFIENTLGSLADNISNNRITGCFFLINKSQPHTINDVKTKLIDAKHIYAFANLHLYTSLKPYETSPLKKEEQRYKKLVKNSFIDSVKVHFQKQTKKLSLSENGWKKIVSDVKKNRHLQMLIATHRLYQYFTVVLDPKLETYKNFVKNFPSSTYKDFIDYLPLKTYKDFIDDLLEKTNSPIDLKKTSETSSPVDLEKESETSIESLNRGYAKEYLKVITQSPFTQYKPLKDHVFKWVIQLLIEHIEVTEKEIGNFDYDSFETLKFLIRRAGLLNSNILISRKLLEFLPTLYGSNGIPEIIDNFNKEVKKIDIDIENILKEDQEGNQRLFLKSFESKKADLNEKSSKLENFHIFYVAQIKELLLRSESRCLNLERNLKFIESGDNPYVRQIVRILREENSLIIKVFYDHISSRTDWGKTYKPNSVNDAQQKIQIEQADQAIEYENEAIESFLYQPSISHHHKFKTLDKYFKIMDQPNIFNNNNLLSYLWLEYFFATDRYRKHDLSVKTRLILKKMMNMFIDIGISKVGAFFIVNDAQKIPFVAFNKNNDGVREIDESSFENEDNKYINKFFEGEGKNSEDNTSKKEEFEAKKEKSQKSFKTVIELKRNENKWVDLFATSNNNIVSDLKQDFVSEDYDRLVLIRLNKRSFDQMADKTADKIQGIIGFYYKSNSEEIIDINIIRYLLLLRPSLSLFIEDHHENDEFRNWQIAEIKNQTSLLTGHGREMLITVASNRGKKYQKIVYTLLTIQRLLIDKKEYKNWNFKSRKINKIFKGFYQDQNKNKKNNNKKKKKSNRITSSYFDGLAEMADDIFRFEEIENSEKVYIHTPDVSKDLSFRFDKELLNMICFEILVNAKKNRWLFADNVTHYKDGIPHEINKIWIKAEVMDKELKIIITNTGPEVSDKIKQKLLEKKNIKKYDKTSGIELIDTIFNEFKFGSIEFETNIIVDDLPTFSVILTLDQNPNGN